MLPLNSLCRLILQILKLSQAIPGFSVVGRGGLGDNLDVQWAASAVNNISSTTAGYPGITGPLTQVYSYNWISGNPKIQGQNISTLLCPNDTVISRNVPT